MLSPANLRANLLVKLGERTGKTHALPLVLFSPTARCNSRCVSCDWWRADGARDLSLAEIEGLAGDLARFGTRVVVFTGGEPLYRPDVMAAADLFRAKGMTLQLLTSGLGLGRYAEDVAARFQAVTVSTVWTLSWRECASCAPARRRSRCGPAPRCTATTSASSRT